MSHQFKIGLCTLAGPPTQETESWRRAQDPKDLLRSGCCVQKDSCPPQDSCVHQGETGEQVIVYLAADEIVCTIFKLAFDFAFSQVGQRSLKTYQEKVSHFSSQRIQEGKGFFKENTRKGDQEDG